MSAPRHRQAGEASPSRRAALFYLQGGISLREAGGRFGVSAHSVHGVVQRMRLEGLGSWPEDEVTW